MAIPTILKGETAKPIPLALAEGYDYAGCSLHVGFCGVRKTFSDLAAGGSLELRFTAEQTAGFPLGTSKAMLSLENATGEIRFMPWAKIKVTDSPADLYDAAITIDPATLNVDDLTSGDALGAVKSKLQAVINFLRGLKVLAVCALPFFALADVEPLYTTPNDMPGDAPLMTNTEAYVEAKVNEIAAATTNLNARPVTIPTTSAGRGVTFVDQYGEDQNVAIEIGEGARAAVTTNALEAAADNKVVRSTGVAIGGHASVENSADPLKIQGVALGWHAQVSAINGVAIGSGAQHTNETGQTSGATVASAPKAIAIGYGAKSAAQDAVQLGEGVNSEPGTLKYRDITIVKNGKVATNPAVTNTLARHEAALDTIMSDYARLNFAESNSVKRVTIQNDNYTFRVVTDTNRVDGVALTMGDAEIYGKASVDSKLAGKADAVRNIIDDRPTFTTNDIWVCEWDGQVLSWSKSGTAWLWQNEARSRGLMRVGNGYNILDVPTHISTSWNGYPADTASVLADSYGWVLTRRNPDGAVTNTVPVAYIDDIPDIPPVVSNTVTKAYVESLGITSEESDPTVPQWAKAAQKPSYTAAEVGATAPAAVTNIVKGLSLGGIWDSGLEVWWTPVMHNGSLTYQATTNVNLNAEH